MAFATRFSHLLRFPGKERIFAATSLQLLRTFCLRYGASKTNSCRPVWSCRRFCSYSSERSQVKVDKNARPKSHYEVLKIPTTATQPEIKAAYFELSMIYHPDKNPSPEANQMFTELTKAYEVLGNLDSRREYDKEIGTYYTLRGQPTKKAEKILRITEEIDIELDAKTVLQGGVFLRTCAAFSSILDLSFRVCNVNLKQRPQGVHARDVTIMMLLRSFSNGTLSLHLGGTIVSLLPTEKKTGTFIANRFPCIALYSALPCLAFAPHPYHTSINKLVLKGTTHSYSSPTIDYMELVYKPIIERFGVQFTLDIKKRACQPRKEGSALVRMAPVQKLQPISMRDPGTLRKISGKISVIGEKPVKISQVLEKLAKTILKEKYPGVEISISAVRERDQRSTGMGQSVVLIGETTTGCLLTGHSLWSREITHEQTIHDSIKMLDKAIQSGTCVDDAMQEMLVVPMALADGRSVLRIGSVSVTAKAAMIAAEVMTDARFNISKYTDSIGRECNVITCEGIGHENADFIKTTDLPPEEHDLDYEENDYEENDILEDVN